jgi:lysophospholipase L1-like esterase
MKRILTLALVLAIGCAVRAQQVIDDKTPAARTTRIVLVGDSTMNHSSGWGGGFCDDLAGDVECFNMARNGRSSKSYRADGFWTRALALASKPGYIIISFAGNDVPGKGPERETDPKTTFYANMKAYVLDARAAGVTPILVTPMEVRKYTKDGKLVHNYDDYAAAIRKVGADTDTPVIDLYAKSNAFLETQTQAQADELDHVDPTQPKVVDRAHLNRTGSALIGGFVAEGLATAVPALAKSVRIQH